MKYITSRGLKRLLFSLRRRRSLGEDITFLDDNNSNGTPKMVGEQAEYCPRTTTTWKCFSFEELSYSTNCFSPENYVGKGGYAEVYKGVLRDGKEVAVKRLTKGSSGSGSGSEGDERKEKEFLSEIGTIGHVCHPNVLPLLGCCVDNGLYLIFHFSSNGSVASLLHDGNTVLGWTKRYKIAIGTARGLHYLHKGCQRRIIHRDIKSSNVLLTPDFEPLISDFGLAKWLPSQWSHHSIAPIEGTFGHLAPEYYTHGIVDEKTDVFAFGVFLLEIISGRKPVDGSTHQSLHSWAKPVINKGETTKLVDPRLGGAYDVIQLERIIFAASLCIRASPTWRPTMSEVLEVMVDGNIEREEWKMPMEEEKEESWSFEDLEECDCDGSFSMSPQNTVSTTTC